jgi:hypothetical protein
MLYLQKDSIQNIRIIETFTNIVEIHEEEDVLEILSHLGQRGIVRNP